MPLKRTLRDLATDARQHIDEIDVEQLAGMLDDDDTPLVIDVREPDEVARGAIPGAVALPRGVLERDIERTCFPTGITDDDLRRPIVCYCGGGSRSLLAAERLKQMGFDGVLSLRGGWRAWDETAKR